MLALHNDGWLTFEVNSSIVIIINNSEQLVNKKLGILAQLQFSFINLTHLLFLKYSIGTVFLEFSTNSDIPKSCGFCFQNITHLYQAFRSSSV